MSEKQLGPETHRHGTPLQSTAVLETVDGWMKAEEKEEEEEWYVGMEDAALEAQITGPGPELQDAAGAPEHVYTVTINL